MKIDKKQLDKGQIELTIRVSKAEAQPYLSHTASVISQQRPIKGFRPGKAPYEIVKREMGEQTIINEAMEDIVNGTFSNALESEKLATYGKVGFDLLPTLNPEEIVAYTALVTLMPTVKLGKWQDKKINREEIKVTDEELNKAMDEMAAMLTSEEPTDRPAALKDKVIIDFEVFVDEKLIEGGAAKDFGMIIGEGKMIPGFEEQLVGKAAGEKIEFTIPFPADYHAKQLSGKPALFKIHLTQVINRIQPPIDDALAKRVGVADLSELKKRLSENIMKEKSEREEERLEIAAIKHLVDTAKFDEIPHPMIDDTAHDLLHDFEHTIAHQGMKFDAYLKSINKTHDDLKKEFEPRAIERVKASMALGQLAEDEKITLTNQEIDDELTLQKKTHANNPKAMNDMQQPEYRRHVANSLINRKIINHLKSKLIA